MSIKVVNIFVSFLKVSWVNGGPPHFSENVEAPECLSSLKIFLYNFYKTPGLPGGPKHFSELVEAPGCL